MCTGYTVLSFIVLQVVYTQHEAFTVRYIKTISDAVGMHEDDIRSYCKRTNMADKM